MEARLTGSAGTMRAARIVAPRTVAIERVRIPEPLAGQIRFRVTGSGVCGSNLGPWQGLPWLTYPLAPGEGGHEAWGVVDAVGENVRALRKGDPVAVLSYRAFAEYDVADAAASLRLPHSLETQPFPGESFACAMNVFRRADVRPGDDVAIVGIGALSAPVVRRAADAGARVIAISRRQSSLDLARELGAAETIPMDDHHRIIERVKELTRGALCRVVIEAVGKQWPLDLAAELTATRGTLVIAGYHQDGPRQVAMQLWNWRGLDVINAHEREVATYMAGMRAAVDAALGHRLDPSRLCTHSYPLENLAEALDATANKPDGFVKAVVLP